MAEGGVTFLLEKFVPLFENEVQLLSGGREEITYARGELERIRTFLRVADSLEESDEEVKVWVKQIRDVAHDTEDFLDEYKLPQSHDHGNGFFASQIREIKPRIKNISVGHRRLHQKFCVAEQGANSTCAGNEWQDQRGDALLLDKTDLVGIDEPTKKLVGWLVNGGSGREVVSIAGMGGLGKTTLAKQVYDDAEVKKQFSMHAWIRVSRSYQMEELLKDIVQQLFTDSMNSNQLKTIIKELLQNRRYLIGLDDVWHLNEWDAIKYALPTNNCGSRVILTARKADLAFTSCIESEGKVYYLEPLAPDESWTLFCRKTFQRNSYPHHLEDICKNILRKCEGLPLAIVAVSGILATKDKRRINEWEIVRRSLGAEIEGNNKLKNLKKVLSLSFNDLPYYLKSCFLYLSIFPEDHPIKHMRLIRLWVAEGFLEAKYEKELEDVAEDYLNKQLVMDVSKHAELMTFYGRLSSQSQESKIFAFIAKEQNVTCPDRLRRLSIHNTLQNVQLYRCVSQLRSLFMFGVVEKSPISGLFPSGFRFLNVLDLQGSNLNKFPIQVNQPILPKVSELERCKVEILKLRKLRHLLVYHYDYESYAHFHSKHGFRALEKIEANQGNGNTLKELRKLTKLRRLGVVKLRKEDGKTLCSSIENLSNLRALSLLSVEEDEILDLQHLFSPPQLLQQLYLAGRFETLPHWIPNLACLVRLHLKWSRLMDDPLESLQILPNLVHLELMQTGGFKKLKLLGINKFDELKRIQVEARAMPRVEKLCIQRHKLLQKVPLAIEYLTKLKALEFFHMPQELIKTLHCDEKERDYWRVAHIPEVYSTYRRDGGWEVYFLESFNDPSRQSPVIRNQELYNRWK
ncbi:hypothetical protein P3X46_032282 [Hevea brasiliensis]|uniref:Disease resistance protein RPM1-like n=1 Tax=Hevea brasiliensis TaxID=3981 RepID=A0ABQ9KE35_HEVBR|nr:hypothetical protein P3X46_032282 [Hevea brasiliensis]